MIAAGLFGDLAERRQSWTVKVLIYLVLGGVLVIISLFRELPPKAMV